MRKQRKKPFAYLGVTLDEKLLASVSRDYLQADREISRLHFHNCHELGYCFEGAGIFMVEGKILPFKAGDALFIARDERHLAQSLRGTVSRWRWLYFDFERLLCPAFPDANLAEMSCFSGPEFQNVLSKDAQPKLCSIVRSLIEAWDSGSKLRKEELSALLALFSIEMRKSFQSRCGLKRKDEEGKPEPDPDALGRLEKALEHMAKSHGGKLELSSLAKLCGLSQTHFRRLFKQTLGKSPASYLAQLRIASAMAELSRSRRPVAEIALSCGFPTLSCFNRQFRKIAGASPREWRKARD